jgi:hypothetical protein
VPCSQRPWRCDILSPIPDPERLEVIVVALLSTWTGGWASFCSTRGCTLRSLYNMRLPTCLGHGCIVLGDRGRAAGHQVRVSTTLWGYNSGQ